MKDPNVYPPGLDARQVREIIEYYDSLTEAEWIAQDEAAYEDPNNAVALVPKELFPAVAALIARHQAENPSETAADQVRKEQEKEKTDNFPPGWDAERVQRLIEHDDSRTKEETIAEDEGAFEQDGQTVMIIPVELAPAVAALIARYEAANPAETTPAD